MYFSRDRKKNSSSEIIHFIFQASHQGEIIYRFVLFSRKFYKTTSRRKENEFSKVLLYVFHFLPVKRMCPYAYRKIDKNWNMHSVHIRRRWLFCAYIKSFQLILEREGQIFW